MLNWLMDKLMVILYVQVWEDRLKVSVVGRNGLSGNARPKVFDERPYIAINRSNPKKPIIQSMGNEAYVMYSLSGVERSTMGSPVISNPFSHPRLLVDSVQNAQKVLQYAVRQVLSAKRFCASPVIIMHPMERLDGGLTEVECRLFQELALGAGARLVKIHVGRELPTHSLSIEDVQEPDAIRQMTKGA